MASSRPSPPCSSAPSLFLASPWIANGIYNNPACVTPLRYVAFAIPPACHHHGGAGRVLGLPDHAAERPDRADAGPDPPGGAHRRSPSGPVPASTGVLRAFVVVPYITACSPSCGWRAGRGPQVAAAHRAPADHAVLVSVAWVATFTTQGLLWLDLLILPALHLGRRAGHLQRGDQRRRAGHLRHEPDQPVARAPHRRPDPAQGAAPPRHRLQGGGQLDAALLAALLRHHPDLPPPPARAVRHRLRRRRRRHRHPGPRQAERRRDRSLRDDAQPGRPQQAGPDRQRRRPGPQRLVEPGPHPDLRHPWRGGRVDRLAARRQRRPGPSRCAGASCRRGRSTRARPSRWPRSRGRSSPRSSCGR